MKPLLSLLFAALLVEPALASPRLQTASLNAAGDTATLAIAETVTGVTYHRSIALDTAALPPEMQGALSALLGALAAQLPEGFERGQVIVERTREMVPSVLAEDEVTILIPEAARVGVAVYGAHPTLGSTVISTAGGTLTVTPENNLALLTLLDSIEASVEQ